MPGPINVKNSEDIRLLKALIDDINTTMENKKNRSKKRS